MDNFLTAKHIHKSFGTHKVLDDVSIEVPRGKVFGLLGPNGAGKSTLIRIITHISVPDSGEVMFDGHPLCEQDMLSIGYLPEERGLYKKMKVGEQAIYLAQLKGLSRSEAEKRLKVWFEKFDIMPWWNKKLETLSKGMQQKVQFVTTVLHEPPLLIFDEPFSGFDPVNVQIIRDEILRLKEQGATIILSTHNMESVEELCDEIALINKSHVVVTGAVDEVRRKYGNNDVQISYSDADGLHEDVVSLDGDGNPNKVLQDYIAKGVRISSFKELIPRMNDIFIKLVKEG